MARRLLQVVTEAPRKETLRVLERFLRPHGVEFTLASRPDIEPPTIYLGSAMLDALKSEGFIAKNAAIRSLRNTLHQHNGHEFFVSYDPRIEAVDYNQFVDLQIDLSLAARYVLTGDTVPKIGSYVWVNDLSEVLDQIDLQAESSKGKILVACDLETTGLDPYQDASYIVSIFFTVESGRSVGVRFTNKKIPRDLWTQIHRILNDPRVVVVGANFNFDALWMYVTWGMPVASYGFDTNLAGSLLDENRSNSLKTHAWLYTKIGGYDYDMKHKYDIGRVWEVPDDDLAIYAGGDTDATYRVAKRFSRDLKRKPRLSKFYRKVLHPANKAFHEIQKIGIHVDTKAYQDLQTELITRMREVESEVFNLLPARLRAKHYPLSLTKPSLKSDYLFSAKGLGLEPVITTSTGKPSTAKAHLTHFADHPEAGPFIDLCFEHAQMAKMLSTYVVGFLKHLKPDGKFHPSFFLFHGAYTSDDDGGTVTGRVSARDPAVQTIPAHSKWAKPLRRCFPAPPGYVVVGADYSQGELRVVACVSGDERMIEAYQTGKDLHNVTASELTEYSYEELAAMKDADPEPEGYSTIRRQAKAINFGNLYGMTAPGFSNYAWSLFGLRLTVDEAAEMQDVFFKTYPRLKDYHEHAVNYARQYKMVESPLGRIRNLPLIASPDKSARSSAERQAINAPIQSCLSDMVLFVLALFYKEYGFTQNECRPFLMTHDSIDFYVKLDVLDDWLVRLRDLMENLPLEQLDWNPQLSFPVDIKHGRTLAEV